MGSGSSNAALLKSEDNIHTPRVENNDSENAHHQVGRRARAKMAAIIKLKVAVAPVVKPSFQGTMSREELRDFVQHRHNDTLQSWTEVEEMHSAREKQKLEKRHDLNARMRAVVNTIPVFEAMRNIEEDINDSQGVCFLCKEFAAYSGVPCRVCDRTFHTDCLQKCQKYKRGELDLFIGQAKEPMGWSCYDCNDITTLMEDEETQEIINSFEGYDVSTEAVITWDKFLNYNEKVDGPLSEQDIQSLRMQFRLLDLDNDKVVSYWEFLTHQAGVKLTYRDQDALVTMLTLKEVARARQKFMAFDTDNDGWVAEKDIRRSLHHWFRRFDGSHNRIVRRSSLLSTCTDLAMRLEREKTSLRLHVDHHSNIIMEGNMHRDGMMNWEDFIKNQAVFILCMRPNRTHFKT